MANETEIPQALQPVTVATTEGAKVMSPTPIPGEPQPQRRQEDTRSYSGEWTILGLALLTWASTFFAEIAQVKTWAELQTPAFLGTHVAQVCGVVLSVFAAKRIK